MPRMIFLSLPVSDLNRSVRFYEAIGCEKNDAFSNEHAAMVAWSDQIRFMLVTHDFYKTLTTKEIADPRAVSHVLTALSMKDRAEVDAISEAALGAGGREVHGAEDLGFMYSRAFEDPDGHGFGPVWHADADVVAAEQPPETVA